jgi:hypothetical protein
VSVQVVIVLNLDGDEVTHEGALEIVWTALDVGVLQDAIAKVSRKRCEVVEAYVKGGAR